MKKKIIVSTLLLFLIIFSYSLYAIYKDVKANCLKAQDEYRSDCVGSLIKVVQSENKTFRQKNSAVWALGQLADKKTLPFLYELNKSLTQQERCDYDGYLCKYEVQKAIRWSESGNITSWMYRGFIY